MGSHKRVIPIYPYAAETTVVEAILHEITTALIRYVEEGVPHSIDLGAMPLSEDERRRLDERLGAGETTMNILSLLQTEITETQYPGVWRVRHYDADGVVRSERIEVVDVPEIVRADKKDIERGVGRIGVIRSEEGMWKTKP